MEYYLDAGPMIQALSETPSEFEMDHGGIRHRPSRHWLRFDGHGNAELLARCNCVELPISHVAFTPTEKWALATKRGDGAVAVLSVDGAKVTYTKREFTVGIQPYGMEIFPEGKLAAVCVHGNEDGNNDEIACIDLTREPFRTIEHVIAGQTPEGVAISPDGKWMAVSVIQGTNLPKSTSPLWSEHGALQLFSIDGTHAWEVAEASLARNNQGVTFTPDGNYILVQNYSEKELLGFRATAGGLQDANLHIKLPGYPASIRPRRNNACS